MKPAAYDLIKLELVLVVVFAPILQQLTYTRTASDHKLATIFCSTATRVALQHILLSTLEQRSTSNTHSTHDKTSKMASDSSEVIVCDIWDHWDVSQEFRIKQNRC